MDSRIVKWGLGCCIAGVLALAVLMGVHLVSQKAPASLPAMSVSIRGAELEGDRITLEWVVGNRSEETITFDDNQIARITLNGKQVLYPVEATSLAPDEEAVFSVSLPGANPEGGNSLEISAACNEGTTGTFQQTLYPSSWARETGEA